MGRLFHLLDQVQERWPWGASLTCVQRAAPPAWALEAARSVVASWSPAERWSYRRQLTALAAWLGLLYRRWVVAAYLAAVLALVMVIAAASGGALTDSSAGVLLAVLSAILLPPFAICNGIAGDYTAAQALLAACHSAGDARADPRSPKECDHV